MGTAAAQNQHDSSAVAKVRKVPTDLVVRFLDQSTSISLIPLLLFLARDVKGNGESLWLVPWIRDEQEDEGQPSGDCCGHVDGRRL